MLTKKLECLKNQKDANVSKLASKFLDLQRECLAKFDTCIYNREIGVAGCTCLDGYIGIIKYLDVKKGESKKLNGAEMANLAIENFQMLKEFEFLRVEANRLGCSETNRSSLHILYMSSVQKILIPGKNRQALTFEVSTCETDRCNRVETPSKPNQTTGSTDGAGNGQNPTTKKDGSNGENGQDKATTNDGSDVSNNDGSNGSNNNKKSTTIRDLMLIALEILLIRRCAT